MRNLKKFLALVLVMMMVFSLMLTVNAATTTTDDFQAAYDELKDYGVFEGVTNNEDAINSPFTRAQMAMVAYRLATGDTDGDQLELYVGYAARFSDVPEGAWYAGAVGFCANYGIVVGYPNGKFEPSLQVTGVQAAAMLLRLLGYDQNGEFTGSGWDYRVLGQAERDGIFYGLSFDDMYKGATRGLAAFLTRNAATIPQQVFYSSVQTRYVASGQGKLLIVDEGDATVTQDVFGAPSKSTGGTVTFNWNNWGQVTNPIKGSDEDLRIYRTYKPITECDLADYVGGKTFTATVYTNGIGNATTMEIDALNTTSFVGAQGRETTLYYGVDGTEDYIIVFKDRVLAQVGDITSGVIDTGAHDIDSGSTARSADVYGNTAMQGKPTYPAYASLSSKPVVAGVNTNTTYYVSNVSATTYKAGGDFEAGDWVYAYILTGTGNNTINGGNYPVNPATGGTYSLATCPNRLVEPTKVKELDITVNAIEYDGSGNIVGFWDTNNVLYMYDVSFGYNAADANFTSPTYGTVPIQVLQNDDIKKTYKVYFWTDGENTNEVLGILPQTAAAEYGVVIGQEIVALNSANSLAGSYGIRYTILTTDSSKSINGTTKQVIYAKDDPTNPGWTQAQIDGTDPVGKPTVGPNLLRHLVKIEANTQNNYSTVTTVEYDIAPTTAVLPATTPTVYVGDADTLVDGVLVNNNTVFFVANYSMNNANAVQGAYSTNGYNVFYGFQASNFNRDMAFSNVTNGIYDNGTQVTSYSSNETAAIDSLDIYAFANGAPIGLAEVNAGVTADYVLILNGTEKTPITERAEKIPSYAYVVDALNQSTVYDEYYLFNILKQSGTNAIKDTLPLNNAAGLSVATIGSGLYIYRADSTNGYNAIVPNAKVNWVYNGVPATPANYLAGTTAWSYNAGVLTVNGSSAPGTMGTNAVNTNGVTSMPAGWNNTYLTVTDNVTKYIVNQSTGIAYKTDYSLSTLGGYYDELYYQVNQYGWIDFIWVVDRDNGNSGPDTSTSGEVTAVTFSSTPSATPTAGTPLYTATDYGTVTVTVASGTAPTTTISKIQWQKANADGVFVNVASGAEVFVTGTYRAIITLEFGDDGSDDSYTIDKDSVSNYAGAYSVYSAIVTVS